MPIFVGGYVSATANWRCFATFCAKPFRCAFATVTYAATANDAVSGSAAVTCVAASGTTFPVGPTTVNCSATDAVGNTTTGHFTVDVNKRLTAILYTGPPSAETFDCVALSAKLTDITATPTTIGGAQITLMLTGSTLTAVNATTNSSGVGSGVQKCGSVAGPYNASATFAGDGWHEPASSTVPFIVMARTVTPQSGWGVYTGSTFFWTANASSSTATVVLTATIVDASLNCTGDIAQAKVTFTMNGVPIPSATNLQVGLITPGDPSRGVASAIVQYNLGKGTSDQFNLGVIINGGRYKRNTPSDNVTISVLVPSVANSINVQGYLSNDGSTGMLTGGTGSTDNAVNTSNISGNVQYNKGGTNPQGKITVWIHSYNKPDGTKDSVLHTYMIQSNAIAQLILNRQTGGAIFSSKANIVDQNTGLNVDSGVTLQVTVTPSTSTSPFPKVGVTATSSKGGGLWFSSQWNDTATVEKRIFNESGLLTNGLVSVQ